MMRFLVPVDGSPHSERAVAHVIRLAQCCGEPPEVHLINVRAPVDSWEVRSFLTEAEVARIQQKEGEEDLRAVRTLLDAAGVVYQAQILSGPIAQTIADYADTHHCDQIIMGTHGRGGLANLFLGSVAAKVIHLANIPITLIR